jgi:hypothetical protein
VRIMSATRLRALSAMFATAVASLALVFAPTVAADPATPPDPDLACRLQHAPPDCTGYPKGPGTCRRDIPAGVSGSADVPGGRIGAASPGAGAAPPPKDAPHDSRPGDGACSGGASIIPGGGDVGGALGLPGLPGWQGFKPDQPPTAPTNGGGVRPGQK